MTETIKTLREALQSADAAIWDKHYGRGLTEAYARGVHEELQNALAALSRLEAEQNRAYPVGCCTSCAVMHPEFHGHKAGCPQDVTAAPGSSTSEPTPPMAPTEEYWTSKAIELTPADALSLSFSGRVEMRMEIAAALQAEYERGKREQAQPTPLVECPNPFAAEVRRWTMPPSDDARVIGCCSLTYGDIKRAAVASPCPPCQKCDSADSLIADSRRLRKIEAAAQEILTVADLRGDSSLPHPSRDAKLWTARMQTAWDELREALEDCGAGAVEPTAQSVEGRA